MIQVTENNEIIVNGKENIKKLKQKNFVRPNKKIVLLPYFDKLNEELDEHLNNILNGIIITTMTENSLDSIDYFKQLTKYISNFGLRITKPMILKILKFLYEGLTKIDQKHNLIKYCATSITNILSECRNNEFSHKDMIIDWKPLYNLYLKTYNNKIRSLSTSDIQEACNSLSVFFAPQQQINIWQRLQEEISIGVSMKKFTEMCSTFLTIEGMNSEEHKQFGCGQWFDLLWMFYISVEMNNNWGNKLMEIFSKISVHLPDLINWKPYFDNIFTKLIRSFDISIRQGKTIIGDGSESDGVAYFAQFLSATIGGPNSSIEHFERTIKCIEFSVHPLNSGEHVNQIVQFLEIFTRNFTARIRRERLKNYKRKVPEEFYVKDEEIDRVAKIIVDAVLMLLFSPDASYTKVSLIIYHLTSLNVGVVAPKILDHIYSAIFAISEPQRLSTIMDALVMVIFQLMHEQNKKINRNFELDYDSFWLEKMEEERKNWCTYRNDNLIDEIKNHKFLSLKHHSIYILEIFVNSIDVNDVGRAEVALKTLVFVFSSIPIMDFSTSTNFYSNEMTKDDEMLCKLSKRIPIIAEEVFEKILKTISCLAVCAPKNSTNNIGTMNDFETNQGTEEMILKQSIDECINQLFSHSSPQLRNKLFNRLFDYISHIEFESFVATDLMSGIISSCVWICDDSWKKFANFLYEKLKILITDNVQNMKEPPSSILFYVVLSNAIFSGNTRIIVENQKIIFEIIEILIECQCKIAYQIGTKGLSYLLLTLTQIYPIPDDGPINIFKKPLNEWNPIKEWAKCYKIENIILKWFVPSKKEIHLAKLLIHKFLYPLILKIDEKLEREEKKRILFCISIILSSCQNIFVNPPSEVVTNYFLPNSTPIASSQLGCCYRLNCEIQTENGENYKELILKKIQRFLTFSESNDPKLLENILSICVLLIDENIQNSVQMRTQEKLITNTYAFLCIPIYGDRIKSIFESMQSFALLSHMKIQFYSSNTPTQPTKFDIEVLKILVKLALNDYEGIRSASQTFLQILCDKIFLCRHLLIDDIIDILTNEKMKNEETIKGAMSTILTMNLSESTNAFIRDKLWEAFLNTKVIDEPKIRTYFETFYSHILSISNTPMKSQISQIIPYKERNKKIIEIGLEIIKNTKEWKNCTNWETIECQRKKYEDWIEKTKKIRNEMINRIIQKYVKNPNLHHTREKLARTMIYRCMREEADENIIKILLSQLIHEEEEQRNEAISELFLWLKHNKPKTIRIDFKPPTKKILKNEKFECGIREDNLFIVYDSMNLPKNEQKWNEMIFIEKQKGSFKWPETINVVRPTKYGKPIENKELNKSEKMILEWFENKKNIEKWVEFKTQEKEGDDKLICFNSYQIIKYVIRNFSESLKTIEIFKEILISLLQSKKKESQILGAEIFVGIVKGIKHRPFRIIDEFWTLFTPLLDRFFDLISSEAKQAWEDGIEIILDCSTDHRRVWWLIEKLIEGSKKICIEEWRQAMRLEMLNISRWRYIETTNRVCEIAWQKLPIAVTDTLRIGISRAFQNVSWLRESNWNNSYQNIDKRFQLEPTDIWISRFIGNISNFSNSNFKKEIKKKINLISKDEESIIGFQLEEKKSLIYFRTLLEFLQQYYVLCYRSWTPEIIKLLPKLFEYSNEDDYDLSEEAYKNIDIFQNSSTLIHDYMSSLWSPPQYIDSIIKILIETYRSNKFAWRVRLAILKFVHVWVYSNIFILSVEERRQNVQNLIFEAIFDSSITVRKEAAKCLLFFVHCEYIKIQDDRLAEFDKCLKDSKEPTYKKHGAALALGALVMAYPFSFPKHILKPLMTLSLTNTRLEIVQTTITETLREFRRQHRDNWEKVKKTVGERTVFEIENAIAPFYYA